MLITVGARRSPLSKIQVEEVLKELRLYHPEAKFDPRFLDTVGDIDLETSLRTLEKSDFFTREIDHLVLKGECRVGIHSAKDLPEPLSDGLAIAALTRGLDPSDALVLRDGEDFSKLPSGSRIATSSNRRQEVVNSLRDDLCFVDIRGPVQDRLKQLHQKFVDGVVVAEAALIRLGLTHLNRKRLPGETTPLQGQLAVVARKDDLHMFTLFECLDSRQ